MVSPLLKKIPGKVIKSKYFVLSSSLAFHLAREGVA